MSEVAIKICGLRDLATARAALDAGADYLGFVLAPSRRQVSPEEIRAIVRGLPPGARTVGVFVNEPAEAVNRVVDECGLGYAQLSGDEPPEVVAAIRAPIFRALRVGGPDALTIPSSLAPLPPWGGEETAGARRSRLPREERRETKDSLPTSEEGLGEGNVVALVLDSGGAGAYGGTGQTCDWSLAARIAARHRSFLAGGLTPENVGAAIRAVRPFGVDVSSGVEIVGQPGRKDVGRIRAFIEAVRMADR